MELFLTREQKKYLNERSPIKADALQAIYKKSVADQQNMLKMAAKIKTKEIK